jgi:dihydroorotate dehydrogenase
VLAWRGIRHGVDGAKTAVVASALAGFLSFFSFLGFGYFDTLHAFVAAVLFQLTVQIMVGADGGRADVAVPRDDEDAGWRRAQWGQLLWVVHAAGLVLAGCVILGIGMTRVFVSEDLAFLCIGEAGVGALGERVISVVAHDRATLGGMLWAAGTGMLLPVLWCQRRGAAWLWWAVAGLGAPAYAAALGMHAWVGYTDWRHIVPALAGLALWSGGLALTRGYLCRDAAGSDGGRIAKRL